MSKKTAFSRLLALFLIGSFVTFYAMNLLLSDLSNMYYMGPNRDLISSQPLFFCALDFVLAIIAVIRLYMRPQYKKAAAVLYTKILTGFSAFGILMALLTGAVIYGSFTAPYPFKGATLLSLAWHLLMLVLSFALRKKAKALPEDPEKRKMKAYYVIYTVALCVIVFFAMHRFGSLLWAPVYAQARTLSLTWSFYLAQLLPASLLGHILIYMFGLNETHPKLGTCYATVVITLDIAIAAYVFLVAMKNPLFISAVSPAVALERLITMPVDTILHFALVLLLGLYCLRYSLKKDRKPLK